MYIGRALPRVEDDRLLTGSGRYTDDERYPGQVWCAFVRSPHAHARILKIDAQRERGVLAVLTGADYAADGLQPIDHVPNPMDVHDIERRAFDNPRQSPQWPLARDVVRHVGEPLAAVIAETAEQARDAAERVEVEYQPLAFSAGAANHHTAVRRLLFLGEDQVAVVRYAIQHRCLAGPAHALLAGMRDVDARIEQCVEDRLARRDRDLAPALREHHREPARLGGRFLGAEVFDVDTVAGEVCRRLLERAQHAERPAAIEVRLVARRAHDCRQVEHRAAGLAVEIETDLRPTLEPVDERGAGPGSGAVKELP